MKQWRRGAIVVLCLLLTLWVVYSGSRLSLRPAPGFSATVGVSFTPLLLANQGISNYLSAESHLWLITTPEQIDWVRFFISPEATTQLEDVDYRRSVVIALLVASGVEMKIVQIQADEGVVTVLVTNAPAGNAQANPTATYQLMRIPRNRTTQAPRKLVLQLLPTMPAPPSPLPLPDTTQPITPVSP